MSAQKLSLCALCNVMMLLAKHVEQILAARATREARLAVADDVINNNGTPNAIASDVARLHAHYLQLASQFVSQEKP